MGNGEERIVVITKWDIISPAGIGKHAFQQGLAGIEPLAHGPDDDSLRELIGKKGTRHLDRTTLLAIAASGLVLDGVGDRGRIGVVLGSTFGSLQSISDFGCETLTADKPYLVNPLHFPNTVMNCAASQVAIRHQCKGLNSTVSGGRLASLNALQYAKTALDLGYAESLLVGGVEEVGEKISRGFDHAGNPGSLGEGCAMFLLETLETARKYGREPVARLIECETGMYDAQTACSRLEQAVHQHIKAGEALLCFPNDIARSGEWEHAVTRTLKGKLPEMRVNDLFGDCYSASGAFQLAEYLSMPDLRSERQGALILSSSNSGMFGFALVKGWPVSSNVHGT